jgi:hypothetical protein
MKARVATFLVAAGALASGGLAGVTFHQPLRSASAQTLVNGATDSVASSTLEPIDLAATQTASAVVDGELVTTDATAGISCTFDPTGVRGRTRLQGRGAVGAAVEASSTIDFLVTVDAAQPWKIHSSQDTFVAGGASSLSVVLSKFPTGEIVFATATGTTGLDRIDETGVLTPGTYRYVYDLTLVASNGRTDRDYTLKFEVPCPADCDDGTSEGHSDGAVTIDDLLFYLSLWEAGDLDADIDNGEGGAVTDEAVTIDDLLFFLVRFEAGC